MLNNSVNVYWACLEREWMLAEPPSSVSDIFYEKYNFKKEQQPPLSQIQYCPSFNGNLKNLFTLKSLYDYNFKIEDSNVVTGMYDQEFFNEHVLLRSQDKKFFSFVNRYIFFTDEPSLEVTFYEYPYLEDNNITQRCTIPSGKFDIGKWFRNTEFAFFLKDGFNEFKIEKDEIYSYVRFHTLKKINFKQFRYNNTFKNFVQDGIGLNRTKPLQRLESYYKNFRNKKLILQEIKNNLIE
jgi:hypothetical protein